MKKTILIILFGLNFYLPSLIYSQVWTTQIDEYHLFSEINNNKTDEFKYSEIIGSPYLVDEFITSKIYFSKDSVFEIKLRYNIYENTMEFKHNKVVYAFSNPEIIEKLTISGNLFIYYYDKIKKKKSSYFQVLVSGNCRLLCQKRLKYEPKEGGNGIEGAKPAQFVNLSDKLFLSIENNPPILIKSKKTIKEVLKKHKTKISNYIKKEKISHRDVDDLTKLIKFYNTLK